MAAPTASEGLPELISLCDRLGQARVLVVGDAMLDRFVRGRVERISPEAPVPVLSVSEESDMPGGAGNVIRNLATLGVAAGFVAAVGDDEAGRTLDGLLAAYPAVDARLAVEPGRPTTQKTRFIAGHNHLLRTDRETLAPVVAVTVQGVLEHLRELVPRYPVIMVSDYGKGLLTPEVLAGVMELAAAHGARVVVDPKGADFSRYRGATVITPNRAELAAATGLRLTDGAAYAAAARRVIDATGVDTVLVTRSEEGLSIYPADGPARHIRAESADVFDVSGAGDTLAAILCAGLSLGAPLPLCARLANIGAGVVIRKVGTAVVHPEELRRGVLAGSGTGGDDKVVSRERLLERVALWRSQGLRVGFTNGCFDLLHPGHALMLSRTRELCDRLVVGLNTDASVRRLKGPSRPVQSEEARAGMLASLSPVDAVTLFNEDTPLELIRVVRPDVLAKGGDYTLETVVGADVVTAYGGRVALIDLEPAASTTDIIARILRTSSGGDAPAS
ncbi:D-glycero-beta-D-manno-heptose 1-phosphate adenylyltransferase [Solidesulfovibrio sp.]|uniref:D-glycero-beta-D-manno-heptose 1-phosphate adenylyltransferase n=1 Tax=Solidesulfovibrio sp. TaxID=2910990 RepID=UPI00262A0A07|nr:D-glycero-beta-D-manno-heptose 1-phosphate adenylyltransferase [Solidesulfovibrio sp.]